MNNQNENSINRRTCYPDLSHVRVPGGKAAGPKPIKANYDADDDRIVDLKQRGHTDREVAEKLAEEGRIRYVPRTVGSRWLRIRKALEAKEEELLEDEMSDWHDEQVCLEPNIFASSLLIYSRTSALSRPSRRSTRRSREISPSSTRRSGSRLPLTSPSLLARRSTPPSSAVSATTVSWMVPL